MKIFRWIGRLLTGLAILLLLAFGILILVFSDWKDTRLAELRGDSEVVETTRGELEFTELGDGPPVLVLHGAPGGYDQARLIGQPLARAGFRIIAPSRPGYLKTPLESGLFFDEQARLMAGLLDKLEIEKTIVIGFSTGASVAVEFARMYPQRTRGLVLISPITQTYDRLSPGSPTGELLEEKTLMWTTGDMGAWLLAKGSTSLPQRTLKAVLGTDADLASEQLDQAVRTISDDPGQLQFFQDLLLTQAPLSPRESGTRNDLLMLKAARPMDLSDIAAPTLVIFGASDGVPEWTSMGNLFITAPDVEKLEVENTGRLVWFGSNGDQVTPEILSFIRSLK